MKLIPPMTALALVALAFPVTADPPIPSMLAQATLDPQGATVAWTAAIQADSYIVERSHAGSSFTVIATVGPTIHTHFDAEGQASDVYLVVAVVGGADAFMSNPAPAVPNPFCDWITLLPPHVNWNCFPCIPPVHCLHPFATPSCPSRRDPPCLPA